MSVILLILKIIGIVLLALLGLILFLILLVLFVPIRYKVSGDIGENTSVHVGVAWLLHLVTWKGTYVDGAFDSCLRILGVRKGLKKPQDVDENSEPESVPGITDRGEAALQAEVAQTEPVQAGLEKEKESNTEYAAKEQRKPGTVQRIKSFFTEIKSRYLKFKAALPGMKDKFSDIKSMIMDENNKIVLCSVLDELRYLLSHFKFRKIDTDLRFSLGDPAATGQALGVLSMMPFLYQYQFRVYPDFEAEKAYIQGTFEVKGKVRTVHGVISLLRLIKKKEVRALLKKLLDNK